MTLFKHFPRPKVSYGQVAAGFRACGIGRDLCFTERDTYTLIGERRLNLSDSLLQESNLVIVDIDVASYERVRGIGFREVLVNQEKLQIELQRSAFVSHPLEHFCDSLLSHTDVAARLRVCLGDQRFKQGERLALCG